MATNIGPKIGIDGEAEYRKQINLIIQQAKTLASEMKLVTSEFTKNTESEVKAAKQSEIMQKQLETQRERVKALTEMLEKSKKETGENSIETAKWQEVVNKATAELNKMESEMDESAEATDDLSDAMEDAEQSTFSFGDALKSNLLAQAIVDGVKRIASEIKSLAGEMIDAAATVKAETSQFEQTFGAFGDQASEAIARVADESGILDTRLNAVGTQIYAFARSSGGSATQSLNLMERALQAAADGAAYYDRSLEDTAEQLQSFLKGNYANDAALGLSATETTRNAEAMKLFGKKFAELSEIQKEETLLQMVLDAQKLSGAMGQAAREADGWENVQGNLNEAWRQFEAKAGAPFLEALIPIIQEITAGLIEWTQSINWEEFSASISSFVTLINENGPLIISTIAGIAAGFIAWNVVSLISGVVTAFQAFQKANEGATIAQAALNLVMSANPIGIIITAIAALVAGLVTLFATNEEFRESCLQVWEAIKSAVSEAWTFLGEFFTQTLPDLFQQFLNFMDQVFLVDWTNIFGPVLGGVMNGFFANLQNIFASIKQIFQGIIDFVGGIFTGDWTRAWNGVVNIFGGIFNNIVANAKAPLNALIGLLNGAIGGINSLISGFNGLSFSMPQWLGGGSWSPSLPTIPNIPYLAKGGTVKSGYAIVGEAGPELLSVGPNGTRVQPLSAGERALGFALGGGGIVVNVNGAPGQDVNELAEIVADKIETTIRQLAEVW